MRPPSSVRPPRPAWRALVALLLLALSAAACGDGGSDAGSDGSGAADGGAGAGGLPEVPVEEGAFPLTIEHRFGSTTIDEEPRRVVTVGYLDHDAVLALGVRPVGAVDWFGERPYGEWPWTVERWGDQPPEIVGERDEYNFEAIAALRPDLIIGLYAGLDEQGYRTLSQIAPTVASSDEWDEFAMPWREMTLVTGQALGREGHARELIAEVDAQLEAVREDHPRWADLELVVADSSSPDMFSVFPPEDAKSQLLGDMGFRYPESVASRFPEDGYFLDLSAEQTTILDVDRVLWLTDAASAERIEGNEVFQNLPVAREGGSIHVPYDDPPIGAAVSFNSVLSIPYAVEQLVPYLEEADAAD